MARRLIAARALLLADGSSDEPLGRHVAALARRHGAMLDVVAPDFARIERPLTRSVEDRLVRMLKIDRSFDLLIVHRDAERAAVEHRVHEILTATAAAAVSWPVIPVVPVRMTEAWLLLDQRAIRVVAGRPAATNDLGLPSPAGVEGTPDPKGLLKSALAAASGHSGRRLQKFNRDFPAHRRQLLERLDRDGPVAQLSAWQTLERDVGRAVTALVAVVRDATT